ncbi:MAG: hypothetical protein JWR25_2105 [Noviherbaspirillum sp.]|jgi:hypothetical protein|nr:hypothetical protein [Noviherbaspirillum sp.]
MNAERYKQLAREFCQCAGLPSDDPFLRTGMLKIDGLDVLLHYDEEFDPERLQIRVDFGELPEATGSRLALALSVLSVNFEHGFGGLHVFSVNPNNGHVVFTKQHVIDTATTAQDLYGDLAQSISEAHASWEEAINRVTAVS